MSDKELKSLSRQELLELLCRMKKEESLLEKRVAELQSQLGDRKLKYEKAGSLAEAMISVNGVMEAAQRAADQYLDEVKNAGSGIEKSCSAMLAKTNEECAQREAEADRLINAKWKEFEQKVENYIQTHAELEALLGQRNAASR